MKRYPNEPRFITKWQVVDGQTKSIYVQHVGTTDNSGTQWLLDGRFYDEEYAAANWFDTEEEADEAKWKLIKAERIKQANDLLDETLRSGA